MIKRPIKCCILIVIMSLSLIASCVGKRSHSRETASSKPAQPETSDSAVIPTTELKSISSYAEVSLTDDSPASIWWTPKTQKATLTEVTSWLQEAKPYNGDIPPSQISGMINANIGPAKLYISTSDKHEITIQPAYYLVSDDGQSFKVCYVSDILQLSNDGQISYIKSSQLFDWLKNDKWKTEFKMKR